MQVLASIAAALGNGMLNGMESSNGFQCLGEDQAVHGVLPIFAHFFLCLFPYFPEKDKEACLFCIYIKFDGHL